MINLKKESIWIQGIKNTPCSKLKQNIYCDVLIIGGGLSGISTAFELRNSKQKVVLIERNKIGFGVSSRTTGKLTYLQGLAYQELEKTFNSKVADLYLKSQKEAIQKVVDNVKNYAIDCDLERNHSITFTYDKSEIPFFQKEEAILKRNHVPYQIKNTNGLEQVAYAIEVDDTYVFHPVKYILALKKILLKEGFSIYENTKALTLAKQEEGYLVQTEEGSIKAKKVIICTHYPYFTIPGFLPLRSHIERSYLVAGQVNQSQKINAITSSKKTVSFRYHQPKENYLLYVSHSHKLGNNLDYKRNYDLSIEDAKPYLKEIDYVWQNHDIMTEDHLPLIGRLQKNNPNLFIATGFNTWGMTNGVLSGKILSDLVEGKENPYEQLFLPYRGFTWNAIKSLTVDTAHSTKTYALSHLKNYYSFYLDEVEIKKIEGKKCGIYIDEEGKHHIVKALCPHLKCGLTFNTFAKTWDCPCHGSRFTMDGDCIEGPSLYSIKF